MTVPAMTVPTMTATATTRGGRITNDTGHG